MELKQRLVSVDMLRGIAVILMIFTHLWITFFLWTNHPIGNIVADIGGYICFTLFLMVSGYVYGLAFTHHTFSKIIKRSAILVVTYVLLGALALMMSNKPLTKLLSEPIYLEEYLLAFALFPMLTYISTKAVATVSGVKQLIKKPLVQAALLVLGFACVLAGRFLAPLHANFPLALFVPSSSFHTFALLSYGVVFTLGVGLGWYFVAAPPVDYKKRLLGAIAITLVCLVIAFPFESVGMPIDMEGLRWPPALVFVASGSLISLVLLYVATVFIGARPPGLLGKFLAWFGHHALDLLIAHLLIIYILSNIQPYYLQTVSFFERDTYLVILFWAIPFFFVFSYCARTLVTFIVSMLSRQPFVRTPFMFPNKTRIAYGILLLLLTTAYVSYYFYTRPYVQSMSPDMDQMYSSETVPATVVFDKPINPNLIKVATAPAEIGADVRLLEAFSGIQALIRAITGTSLPFHFYTGLALTPQHSLPYETGFMYYIVGISSPSGVGGVHEHSYVMTTPTFPKIIDTSVHDQQQDVSTTEPFRITTDSDITSSYQLTALFTPAVAYTVKQEAPRVLAFYYDTPLQQNQIYKIALQHAEQRVNLQTRQATLLDDPVDDIAIQFRTVVPPEIKSVTPNGLGVLPKSDIVVTFTEPMEPNSIVNGIQIEPAIQFTHTWSADFKQVTLHPTQLLAKGTKYTVTLTTMIRTAKGGSLPKPYAQTFETVGHVRVISSSPRNGSGGQSISSNISITFDQAVDHTSAQQHISISPNIGVRYSWKGNTVTLSPKSSLSYQTKYTVTVKSGIKTIDGMDGKDTHTFSFTTRQYTVTIYVPLIKQPNGSFYCNVVATQMALSAKGVGSSISSIVGYIGSGTPYNSSNHTGGNPNADWIDNYGVHWGPLASYINSRGRTAVVHSGWSLSGIAHEIAKGNPVIIFWYNGVSSTTMNSWYSSHGARPGLHSVVVYGFRGSENNPDTLYVKDPWPSFNQQAYSAAAFRSKWSYFGNRAIVVK